MHDAEAIDALTAKVNELARVCALLGRENAELRSRVSALSAWAAPAASVADLTADDTQPGTGTPDSGLAGRAATSRISRRAAVSVALAGAAAGIAGVTALTERSGGGAPAAKTPAAAELTAVAETAAAAPTATGSVLNASLSTVSAVVVATNTNTGPGVHATSSHGRGGIFAGGAAQVQLAPGASSHPRSGELGDLYADSAGRLWYCKKTGAKATWHQIA